MMGFNNTGKLPSNMNTFASFVVEQVPEILLWALFFVVVCDFMVGGMVSQMMKARSPQRWEKMKSEKSPFMDCEQTEFVFWYVIMFHHLLAGVVFAMGYTKTGLLIELGFEMLDLVKLVFSFYPYHGNAQKGLMYKHHLAGLLCILPVLYSGLAEISHVGSIASWLLVAGAISSGASSTGKLLDASIYPMERFFMNVGVTISIFVARFIALPYHMIHLVLIISTHPFANVLYPVIFTSLSLMMMFNLTVLKILSKKTIESYLHWQHLRMNNKNKKVQ